MAQIPQDEASKEKIQLLLFQLGELLKDPPIVINFLDWRDNVEDVMGEIKDLSPYVYDRLQDLIIEVARRAEVHVEDLDNEAVPNDTERSYHEYFAQAGFVASEINSIKSL